MSFGINGPSNKPVIQEAQNMMNNGGGGNLGYFQREETEENIRFQSDAEDDCFEKSLEDDFEVQIDENDVAGKFFAFLKRIWAVFKSAFVK